jgi:16S rRNA (uracil1498-N3)-methyltransferase
LHRRNFLVNSEQLKTDLIILEPEEANHAARVLRLKVGDEVYLLDGKGGQALALIERLSPMLCRIVARPCWNAPLPRLVILMGLSKTMDLIVQKFTELMIDEIIPFTSSRSVVEPGTAKVERWNRISLQALKQCGAPRAPKLAAPVDLESVLKLAPERVLKIMAHELEEEVYLHQLLPASIPPEIWIMVGPEGGFTPEEAEMAVSQYNFLPCRLLSCILRSETAALFMASVLRSRWNG